MKIKSVNLTIMIYEYEIENLNEDLKQFLHVINCIKLRILIISFQSQVNDKSSLTNNGLGDGQTCIHMLYNFEIL